MASARHGATCTDATARRAGAVVLIGAGLVCVLHALRGSPGSLSLAHAVEGTAKAAAAAPVDGMPADGSASPASPASTSSDEFVIVTGGTRKETCGLVWFLHSLQRYTRVRVVVYDIGPPHFDRGVLRRAHRGGDRLEFERLTTPGAQFNGGNRDNWRGSAWKPLAVERTALK